MNRDHGLDLPRWLQVDFSASVQALAEQSESEVQSEDIYGLFLSTYKLDEPALTVGKYQLSRDESVDQLSVQINGLDGSPRFLVKVPVWSVHSPMPSQSKQGTKSLSLNTVSTPWVQTVTLKPFVMCNWRSTVRACVVWVESTDIVHATMGAILSGLVATVTRIQQRHSD